MALNAPPLQGASHYTPYAFTNFAGSVKVSGISDGTGNAARFDTPAGVATDDENNIYVSDSANTIRKITPIGVVTTLAGSPGIAGASDGIGSDARFNDPHGLAADKAGNVYVADSGNHAIRKITPAREVTTLAGSPGQAGSADGTGSGARFYYPEGIALDAAGNIYVGDTLNNTIRQITPGGVVQTLAGDPAQYGGADGTGSAAQFNSPMGIAVDAAGMVYVADSGNNTIRRILPGGLVATLAGDPSQFGFTDGTGRAAQFISPQGVAVDSAGNVYVAEETDDMIRKVTALGTVTTLAGTPSLEGSSDGIGSKALFYGPVGVAVDSVGNLYVADANNKRITKGTQAYLQFRVNDASLAISNGAFHAWLTGPPNSLVVLEASSDLRLWTLVQTSTLLAGGMDVSMASSLLSQRFLRVRPGP
jgi:sugar lactone lactonase YvrE